MERCSFCGEIKRLTKEHIWSNIVLRLFDDVAPLTIDHQRGVAHNRDSVVKDLCKECNGLMSPVDTEMGNFANRYLRGELTCRTVVHFDDPNILRWVMKTVSNHERSLQVPSTWWKDFVGFFQGQDKDTSQIDLFLAPWVDLSPLKIATDLGWVLTLGAMQLMLQGLKSVDTATAHEQISTSWALKVGSGVFGLLVWKTENSQQLRDSVVNELREYGWLLRGRDSIVGQVPFNAVTCVQYNIPSHPQIRDPFRLFGKQLQE